MAPTLNDGKDESSISENEIATDQEETEKLPIDRGWAWVVLVGAFMQMFFLAGVLKCTGILFVEIQKRFGSSASETSLLLSLSTGVHCVVSLLLTTVGMKLVSHRVFVMVGACVCSLSYVVTSQATTFPVLFFSHGVLFGVGQSLTFLPMFATIAVYFNKRRGLANGVTAVGGSVGSLAIAQVMTRMFEYYGFSGSFLLLSGFFLQVCISGAMFRPLDVTKAKAHADLVNNTDNGADIQKQNSKIDGDLDLVDSLSSNNTIDSFHSQKDVAKHYQNKRVKQLARQSTLNYGQTPSKSEEDLPFLHKDAAHRRHPRHRTFSDSSTKSALSGAFSGIAEALSNTTINKYSSVESLMVPMQTGIKFDQDSLHTLRHVNDGAHVLGKKSSSLRRLLKAIIDVFDFGLFKNPIFVCLLISQSLLGSGIGMQLVYIAPHARDTGLSEDQIGLLFTVVSAVEVFARPSIGFVADKNIMAKAHLVALCITILGVSAHCITLYNSYGAIFVFCVIFGCVGGVYVSLFTVLLVEYLGLDKFRSAMGFTTIFNGAMAAFITFAMGALRDSTRSYIVPFRVLGGINFLAAIMLCVTAYAHRKQKDKEQNLKG